MVGFEPLARFRELLYFLSHPYTIAGEFFAFVKELAAIQEISDAELLQVRELPVERRSLILKRPLCFERRSSSSAVSP
jgi:hypothetical protein